MEESIITEKRQEHRDDVEQFGYDVVGAPVYFDKSLFEQKSGQTKQNEQKKTKRNLVGTIILALLFVGIYLGGAISSYFIYWNNTSIGGVDVSYLTKEQAKEKVERECQQYQLLIHGRNKQCETIQGDEIDAHVQYDFDYEKPLVNQKHALWISEQWFSHVYEGEVRVSYDKQLLYDQIRKLSMMQKKNMIAVKEPTFRFLNSEILMVPEEQGTTIVLVRAIRDIEKAVADGKTSVDLTKNDVYLSPQYTRESEEVLSALRELKRFEKTNITYYFGNRKEVIDGERMLSWTDIDSFYNVHFREEEIRNFVTYLAETYDTYGKERKFHTTTGHTVEVLGRRCGWQLNQEQEYEELKLLIRGHAVCERNPVYLNEGVVYGETNDIGSTYVEINLTTQHLYCYVDGTMVLESDFVSGRPYDGHATPPGLFRITYTERNAILRGPGYETRVAYWMPFNMDIGMHDATWQPAFGGTRYLTNGSHGCINLPLDKARQIFDLYEKGDMVVCYHEPS